MHRLHAEHNEEVCRHLNVVTGKNYNDWVVTTAFYSALHYVNHEIFPRKIKGTKYECLNSYYTTLTIPRLSQHNVTKQLVEEFLGDDAGDLYESLLNSSKSARYNDYKVSDQITAGCLNKLDALKKHIKKP